MVTTMEMRLLYWTNNESEWYNEEFDEIRRVKKMKHSYQRLDLQLDTMNFKMR